MAINNQRPVPKASPFSLSLWQDTSDELRWNWSVHRGTHVHKKGHSLEYHDAANTARLAFDALIQQFQGKR